MPFGLRTFSSSRIVLRSLMVCAVLSSLALAQVPGAQDGAEAERAAVLAKQTALRDTFIARVKTLGLNCPIAAPTIVVDHVPSFGQYADGHNTLRTADWYLLSPPEKGFFMQLAGPGADEAKAHEVFEQAAHRWIFIHEMGHWVQACRKANVDAKPYQMESGANRIALAYWRENGPSLVALMMSLFHAVLDHAPSPVPAGENVEDYFNTNYQTLGPSPAYPWFQSRMNVTAEEEKPAPALAAVIAGTKPAGK